MKLPTANHKAQGSRGFTLIETLIATVLFVIILVPAVNLFVSSFSAQRQVVWSRKLADELSFFTESLSRALRESQRSAGSCDIASGWSYEGAPNELEYIDSDGRCHRVYLALVSGIGTVRDDVRVGVLGAVVTISLTSPNVDVQTLRFELLGAQGPPFDLIQPRVTIFLQAIPRRVPAANPPLVRLQTTISQRNLDE